MRRIFTIAAILYCIPFYNVGAGFAVADDEIVEVIKDVETAEKLYSDVDVKLFQSYRSFGEAISNAQFKEITAQDNTIRFISQDNMFRVETQTGLSTGDRVELSSRFRLFDGVTTKMFEGAGDGTPVLSDVVQGRSDDPRIVRPHMLLLRTMHYVFPLSVYLRGRSAIAAYPDNRYSNAFKITAECKGVEDVRGLPCEKIWITESEKETDEVYVRWVLWLAQSKNFIPAKLESYMFRWSKDVPCAEGEVAEWREIRKGIWFPILAEITRYDDPALQSGEKKLKWREDYTIKAVSLEPKFDVAFFRELEVSAK